MKIFENYLLFNSDTEKVEIEKQENEDILKKDNKSYKDFLFSENKSINMDNIFKDNLEEYEKLKEYDKRRSVISLDL